jgi:predicted ATPase/DNA-binding SARP family transcriptional activator
VRAGRPVLLHNSSLISASTARGKANTVDRHRTLLTCETTSRDPSARLAERITGIARQRLDAVVRIAERYGGELIRQDDHAATLAFDSALQAVAAALRLQAGGSDEQAPLAPASMRIALHTTTGVTAPAVDAVIQLAASAAQGDVLLSEPSSALVRDRVPGSFVTRVVPDREFGGRQLFRIELASRVVPNNLPAPADPFIGREGDLQSLRETISEARIMTITGPPGVGKSRLMLEYARRWIGRYPDGCFVAWLASIQDPQLVRWKMLEAVGATQGVGADAIRILASHLTERSVLLSLDNFEHVSSAASDVAALVSQTESVTILTTSRTPLLLAGEREFPLGPLELPGASAAPDVIEGTPAGRFFFARVRDSNPQFRLSPDEAVAATSLLRSLDGLPLAMELAAARVRVFGIQGLSGRLRDRLGTLRATSVGAVERHQSLDAAVRWSYQLLDPAAQLMYRHMAVFSGGATLEAIAAVSPALPDDDALSALEDVVLASLLQSAGGRFQMLETIRAFGMARLREAGELGNATRRHRGYYLALAEQLAPRLTGADPSAARKEAVAELDNVRTALRSAVDEGDAETAHRIATATWRVWQLMGLLLEAADWLDEVVAMEDRVTPAVRARTFMARASIAYWRGALPDAIADYELARRHFAELDDDLGLAEATYGLACAYTGTDPRLVIPTADHAIELYRACGDDLGVARARWIRVEGLIADARQSEAEAEIQDVVREFRRLESPFDLQWALWVYGKQLIGTDRVADAGPVAREMLELAVAAEDEPALMFALALLGQHALLTGDVERGTRLLAGARRQQEESGTDIAQTWGGIYGSFDAQAVSGLTPEAFAELWHSGSLLDRQALLATARGESRGNGGRASQGLHVFALGSLRVLQNGAPIRDWGGPKSGARQALALFAFLFDRGERGVEKDEVIDLIWPEASVESGETSFHRTLMGLRRRIAPSAAQPTDAIRFDAGRYRLGTSVIAWSDVSEFESRLTQAAETSDQLAAIGALEAARELCRGEYLDDCPFYGDSAYVEPMRTYVRGKVTDMLVSLASHYERRGDQATAAARYRQAILLAGDLPRAAAALARLGTPSE